MEHQEHDKWCWAAVAVSCAHHYRVLHPLTQCEVASRVKDPLDCCSDPAPCNKTDKLVPACGFAGVTATYVPGVADEAGIHKEMSGDLPLGWRCEWGTTGKSAHFAVISAIQPSAVTHVDVEDPWFGWSSVALLDLRNGRYLPEGVDVAGRWTDTYFTDRPGISSLRLLARRLRRTAGIRLRRGGPR
jgi:hypothetical protein